MNIWEGLTRLDNVKESVDCGIFRQPEYATAPTPPYIAQEIFGGPGSGKTAIIVPYEYGIPERFVEELHKKATFNQKADAEVNKVLKSVRPPLEVDFGALMADLDDVVASCQERLRK